MSIFNVRRYIIKMVNTKEHPITWALIIANILVFILVFSLPNIEAIFEGLSFSWDTKLEVWRWFTSLFLHVSASHLFFNMLGLFFFGRVLEKEVSRQWFVSIYFISGLLGTFVYMFTSTFPVVGASGAVFGVMGAAMLLNPIKKVYIYIVPLPLGIVAIAFVIFETLAVFFQPAQFADITQNVANVAHLGGVMTGAMFALFFDPKRSVKGILVLAVSVLLLIILAPIFGLIAGFAGLVLGVIDFLVGLVLYGLAGLLSVLWG
jgi:membrane associated rhomboid family serine protease